MKETNISGSNISGFSMWQFREHHDSDLSFFKPTPPERAGRPTSLICNLRLSSTNSAYALLGRTMNSLREFKAPRPQSGPRSSTSRGRPTASATRRMNVDPMQAHNLAKASSSVYTVEALQRNPNARLRPQRQGYIDVLGRHR